jgi:CpeT protein
MQSAVKFLLVLIAIIALCSFQKPGYDSNATDLALLKEMMSGNFDSKDQATADSNYFEIHLHMKPIWPQRSDGFWLYVEQALVTMQDKPYRQRVYHVHYNKDNNIISEVFELNAPLRFTGAWKQENPLSALSPDSLISRQGCGIALKKNTDGTFSGSTLEKNCLSNLRGAKYASSEVSISKQLLISWDRGFDEKDQQVWGAEKGGYRFVKR